jgi:hypothetical protein
MSHPSNDELLELVLGGEEECPDVDRHIRTCIDCSVRFTRVRQEQDLLRTAFRVVPAGETIRRQVGQAPRMRWVAIAAAGLLVVLGTAIALRVGSASSAGSPWKRTPVALERMHRKLHQVVQKVEDTRETLASLPDERKTQAYVNLLSEEETLYADSLEGALDPVSPLSAEQSTGLRSAVREFMGRFWQGADAIKLAADFRTRVREILNDAQFGAFEEYAAAEKEWDRENDIERFTADLAQQFDLRYSESRRVRETLEANYPSDELPLICLAVDVSDILLERPPLTQAVREALEPEHRAPLDAMLQGMRHARDESDRIVRLYRRSH